MAKQAIMTNVHSTIALLLTLGLFSTTKCMTLERTLPFNSRKAPSQTIHNYSIVHPLVVDRTENKNGGHSLELTLSIAETIIHLKLNQELLPSHFISRHFTEQGEAVTTQGHVNCYYQGWVEDHPDWTVTMSTCHGLRGSFGDSSNEYTFYHIEPEDASTAQLDSPHVLYLEAEYEKVESHCATPHSVQEGSEVIGLAPNGVEKSRLKRQNSLGEQIVEWAVINDRAQFQAYGSLDAVAERAMAIANYIDDIYRRQYRIRIVLTYLETWNTGDRIDVVSNPGNLLDNLEVYSMNLRVHRDSTMLMTGIDLDGSTVGIANIRGMCTSTRSVGLTQDTMRSLESTGAVAAHELGHIFNMEHDDGRQCTCPDPTGNCIMSAVGGGTPSIRFSSCSEQDLNQGLNQFNLGFCLSNEPDTILGIPVCGNGLREEGETCDCGTLNICTDPCCNATSCQLINGAQCFSGDCCSNCQYRPYGTTCRSSTQECDIAEYCSGESSDCPEDSRVQNGQVCNDNTSYCFSGSCLTYDSQCQIYFSTNKGIDDCYRHNERGDGFGNCGHDISRDTFLPCAPEDAMCGVLYCQPGSFTNVDNIRTFVVTVSGRDETLGSQDCRGSVTPATSDAVNPGLVDDGTRCGGDRVCFQRRCVPLSSLNIPQCPVGSNGLTCSGQGVCNNENMCSCNVGFSGFVCDALVSIPGGGEGGASSAGAVAGGIIGALLILALVAAVVVAVVVVVIKLKGKGKYNTSRSSRGATRTAKPMVTKSTTVNVVHPKRPPPSRTEREYTPPHVPSSRPSSHPPPRTPPSRPHNAPPPRPHNAPPPRPHNAPPPRPQNTAHKAPPAARPPPPKPMPAGPPPAYRDVTNRSAPPKPAAAPRPHPASKPPPATRKPLVPPRP